MPHGNLGTTDAGHAPEAQWSYSGPTAAQGEWASEEAATAADRRSQAVTRLRRMSVLHAQLAWQHRRRAPLAPYGLAYLFAFPDLRRPRRFAVAAATRLWKAGPESARVDQLLFHFDRYAADLLRSGPFDIREVLANRCDDMPADAFYIGVGLSTLDTHTGSWHDVLGTAESDTNVPGRIVIVLADHTVIVCERRGLNEFNEFQVHSTHSLEVAPGRSLYIHSWVDADQLRADRHNGDALRFLEPLHETLWQADNARLAHRPAGAGHRVRGGGHGR